MRKKIQTILIAHIFILLCISLRFKNGNDPSIISNKPLAKYKMGIKISKGEDRGLSTSKMLLIADGVGGSEAPAGMLAEMLISEIALNLSTNWANYYWSSSDKKQDEEIKRENLNDCINDSLDKYNSHIDSIFKDKEVLDDDMIYKVKSSISTTLVGAFLNLDFSDNKLLTIFQYGDSVAMVFKKELYKPHKYYLKPTVATQVQQYEFNAPFQFGPNHKIAKYKDLKVVDIKVEKNDIVILASDGLYDNIPHSLISIIVNVSVYIQSLLEKYGSSSTIFDKFYIILKLITDFHYFTKLEQHSYLDDLINPEEHKTAQSISGISSENNLQKKYKNYLKKINYANPYYMTIKEIIRLRYSDGDKKEQDRLLRLIMARKNKLDVEIKKLKEKIKKAKTKERKKSYSCIKKIKNCLSFHTEKIELIRIFNPFKEKICIAENNEECMTENSELGDNEIRVIPLDDMDSNEEYIDDANHISDAVFERRREILRHFTISFNIFKVYTCKTSDYFEAVSNNDTYELNECINRILEGITFNEAYILDKVNPDIISKILVKTTEFATSKIRDLLTPFAVEYAKKIHLKPEIKPKKDDITVAVGIIEDSKNSDIYNDISRATKIVEKAKINVKNTINMIISNKRRLFI